MSEPERWQLMEEAGDRLKKLAKLKLEGLTMDVIGERMQISRAALYRMIQAADLLVDRRKLSKFTTTGARTK